MHYLGSTTPTDSRFMLIYGPELLFFFLQEPKAETYCNAGKIWKKNLDEPKHGWNVQY